MRTRGTIGSWSVAGDNVWRSSAFATWVSLLSLSFFLYTADDPFLAPVRRDDVLTLQVVALLSFFCVAYWGSRRDALTSEFTAFHRFSGQSLITWFFAYLALTSLFAASPLTALGYAIATWLAFVMSERSWPRNAASATKAFTLTTALLVAILAGIILRFGYQGGRILGGNQPNSIGQLAFVLIVCALLSSLPLRLIGLAVGVFFIYLVNSRSSALALAVFLLLFVLVPPYGKYLPNFFIRVLLLTWFGAMSFVVLLLMSGTTFSASLIDWLRLYDPGSGFGSGMTGRTRMMALAVGEIQERPFFGNGFRVEFANGGGHSGYLSLIGESGIVGASILSAAILSLTFVNLKNAADRALDFGDRWSAKVIAAFVGSNLVVLWAIEPMYISLGFPTQALLVYFLAKPNVRKESGQQQPLNSGESVRELPSARLPVRGS